MANRIWTSNELETLTDFEFLVQLVNDKLINHKNAMSPLAVKLRQVEARLENKIAEERAEAEKPEDTNLHIDILEHDISYFLRDTDLEIGYGDCEYEHITHMIGQGYTQGELNKTDPENPDETFTGWWSIVKD